MNFGLMTTHLSLPHLVLMCLMIGIAIASPSSGNPRDVKLYNYGASAHYVTTAAATAIGIIDKIFGNERRETITMMQSPDGFRTLDGSGCKATSGVVLQDNLGKLVNLWKTGLTKQFKVSSNIMEAIDDDIALLLLGNGKDFYGKTLRYLFSDGSGTADVALIKLYPAGPEDKSKSDSTSIVYRLVAGHVQYEVAKKIMVVEKYSKRFLRADTSFEIKYYDGDLTNSNLKALNWIIADATDTQVEL